MCKNIPLTKKIVAFIKYHLILLKNELILSYEQLN